MAARWTRRRTLGTTAALLAATLGLAGCAADGPQDVDLPAQAEAALADDVVTQLDEAVRSAMAATASTGAIAGVWSPWSGSWVSAIGTDATGSVLTSDMTFRAGDVTRMMTCDVLYAMVDDELVALNDSVVDYVQGVPSLEAVTLLDLCNGTGGIGAYEPVVGASWITNPERVWHPLEIASFGVGQPRSAVGTEYRDSDSGYVLLGMALERASGQDAAELYDRYIFTPLGLDNTTLPGTRPALPGTDPLHGYRILSNADGSLACDAPLDVSTLSSSVGFTDSGVVSTVTDLGRYVQATAVGALAPESAEGRWSAPLPVYAGAPAWFTTTGGALQAGSLVGQYGGLPGYLTAAFADPETGMTVVVVLNNSTASAQVIGDLAFELAAIASKAPAASGATAPEFGLPWTAQQYHDSINQTNICR
ncbi:serine hydrolase domain-containing protein [Microbacterium lacus]|uniref:serine hydrolase domain-containing protein n=1 Tax=Microbacterium lacus TaxID=415217 RepID=UPI000C2BD9A2|nr:serine hydrolase domain-containing protein [Microbacterium lacus]